MIDTEALRQINYVIEHDSASSTYKYVLLKSVINASQKYDHLIKLEKSRAIIPLGLIIEQWILDYMPFVFKNISQQNNKTVLDKPITTIYNNIFQLLNLDKTIEWEYAYIQFIKALQNPKTTLTNKQLPDGFERADSFISKRRKDIDETSFIKVLSMVGTAYNIDKAKEIAQTIVDAHKPIEFDYAKKFKISKDTPVAKESVSDAVNDNPKGEVDKTKSICPRCREGELLIRKIKSKKAKEKHKADEFIGCSRYPKCRYTESLDS